MNEKIMEVFACYLIDLLVAKKTISAPTSQEMCDDMVQMVCRDFKQYMINHGMSIEDIAPEPAPRTFTITRKIPFMCQGSKLNN